MKRIKLFPAELRALLKIHKDQEDNGEDESYFYTNRQSHETDSLYSDCLNMINFISQNKSMGISEWGIVLIIQDFLPSKCFTKEHFLVSEKFLNKLSPCYLEALFLKELAKRDKKQRYCESLRLVVESLTEELKSQTAVDKNLETKRKLHNGKVSLEDLLKTYKNELESCNAKDSDNSEFASSLVFRVLEGKLGKEGIKKFVSKLHTFKDRESTLGDEDGVLSLKNIDIGNEGYFGDISEQVNNIQDIEEYIDNVSVQDDDNQDILTFLARSAEINSSKLLKFFKDAGADPNITSSGELRIPLHFAARQGHYELIQTLCNAGNIDQEDGNERTPLEEAVKMVLSLYDESTDGTAEDLIGGACGFFFTRGYAIISEIFNRNYASSSNSRANKQNSKTNSDLCGILFDMAEEYKFRTYLRTIELLVKNGAQVSKKIYGYVEDSDIDEDKSAALLKALGIEKKQEVKGEINEIKNKNEEKEENNNKKRKFIDFTDSLSEEKLDIIPEEERIIKKKKVDKIKSGNEKFYSNSSDEKKFNFPGEEKLIEEKETKKNEDKKISGKQPFLFSFTIEEKNNDSKMSLNNTPK